MERYNPQCVCAQQDRARRWIIIINPDGPGGRSSVSPFDCGSMGDEELFRLLENITPHSQVPPFLLPAKLAGEWQVDGAQIHKCGIIAGSDLFGTVNSVASALVRWDELLADGDSWNGCIGITGPVVVLKYAGDDLYTTFSRAEALEVAAGIMPEIASAQPCMRTSPQQAFARGLEDVGEMPDCGESEELEQSLCDEADWEEDDADDPMLMTAVHNLRGNAMNCGIRRVSVSELLAMFSRDELLPLKVPEDLRECHLWTEVACTSFIESLLLGIAPCTLFVKEQPDGGLCLIDGTQRLMALADFIGDEFALAPGALIFLTELAKLKWSGLPNDVRVLILSQPFELRMVDPDMPDVLVSMLGTMLDGDLY